MPDVSDRNERERDWERRWGEGRNADFLTRARELAQRDHEFLLAERQERVANLQGRHEAHEIARRFSPGEQDHAARPHDLVEEDDQIDPLPVFLQKCATELIDILIGQIQRGELSVRELSKSNLWRQQSRETRDQTQSDNPPTASEGDREQFIEEPEIPPDPEVDYDALTQYVMDGVQQRVPLDDVTARLLTQYTNDQLQFYAVGRRFAMVYHRHEVVTRRELDILEAALDYQDFVQDI